MALDDLLKIMAAMTPIVLAVLAYYTAKANAAAEHGALVANANAQQAKHAAERVESTLAQSTDATTEKLDTIHTLVNSRLTEALKKIDRLEQRLYETTGEPPTGEPPKINGGTGISAL